MEGTEPTSPLIELMRGVHAKHKSMTQPPDITDHPLSGFFTAVATEYNRGRAKYGCWSQMTEAEQARAVQSEYHEWLEARDAQDVDGPHGEIAELPQVAAVAGRRWLIKTQQEG